MAMDGVNTEHLLACAYGGPLTAQCGWVWCYLCDDWVEEDSICPGYYETAQCGHERG